MKIMYKKIEILKARPVERTSNTKDLKTSIYRKADFNILGIEKWKRD